MILIEIIIQLIFKIGGLSEKSQSLKNIKYSMECRRKFYIRDYTRTRRKIKSKCVYVVILCIFLYHYTLRKDVMDFQENPKNSWDITLT